MYKRYIPILLILAFVFSSSVFAQVLVGSIYGTVKDKTDAVLPGVLLTTSGANLIGVRTTTTITTGTYRFPSLPPGVYVVKAELEGFQTMEVTGIVVHAGKSTLVNMVLGIAGVAQAVTVRGETPPVDVKTSKVAVTMTAELLNNLPIARDLYDIVNAAPGAISENVTYRRTSSIHGATVRGNTYAFDGVNMNDPVVMYPITNVNFDVMDEVELIVGGHPAETGYTDGAFVNVVTKTGGDEFHGAGTVYYTNENFAQVLFTKEQLDAMGVTAPEYDKSWFDGSFSMGGPISKEKLWFFGNARYIKQQTFANFVPWTDPLGTFHDKYDWEHTEKMGFIKVTGQAGEKLRIMGHYNYVLRSRPMYDQPAWNLPFLSTQKWDGETGNTINGVVTYVFNPDTFMDVRVGYVRRWFPLPLQDEAQSLPWLYEAYTGHYFGTARFNETYLRKRFQTGVYVSKFADNVAGGNHEIKMGFEIENAYGDWDWWRQDNLNWYWYDGSPYYYGIQDDGIGKGRIYFYICGTESGSTHIKDKANRIGFYIQDTATFGRLTINAGIRYDRTNGWKPAVNKQASGNPVSRMLGETLVRPEYGINPWGEMTAPEWKDIMAWNSLSPRAALTYDLTGDGKTALRVSFARYTEYMALQYFSTVHVFYPRSSRFYWYDDNMNGEVDVNDSYTMYPYDYRVFDPEFSKKKIDPNISSPTNDELIIGFQREVARDFSVGVNYIYKHKKNIFEDALYSIDDDKYFYLPEQVPGYWIPFTTIVPGADEYPDSTVTFYVKSEDAPGYYWRATNAEGLWRKYQALEFVFNKRMSNKWQFAGSLVYSKAYGTIGGWYGQTWGWSGAADDPNFYVNQEGRLNIDRPLVLKLFGTYELPKGFLLSASYRLFSGAPYTRGGYMVPPDDWCEAHNATWDYYWVNVEASGSYRRKNESFLDLRLEKQIDLGGGRRLGVYFDAFNVLGWSDVRIGENDLYIWYPDAENTTEGTVSLSGTYKDILNVRGIRIIKFSGRITF